MFPLNMSGKICAVFGCNNYEVQKDSRSFFRFPRDKKMCDLWVFKCQRSDLDEIYKNEGPLCLNKNYKICSDHFQTIDFWNPPLYGQGVLSISMEEPVFVKCEPAWSSDTEEATNFENSQLVSEMIPLKQEREPEPAFELFAEVKNEILLEEHTDDQLAPGFEEEDNTGNVAVLTRGAVDSCSSICKVLKTGSEVMCAVPADIVSKQNQLCHSGGRTSYQTASSATLSPKSSGVGLTSTFKERPYLCNECGKEFAVKSKLSEHMLTHTGQRPYHCKECDKMYTHKSSLCKHMLTHSGEGPHSCNVCGKGFTVKSKLSEHKLIHTGERPHCCMECGRRFIQKCNLVKHMLTHTGERSHYCNICGKGFTQKYCLSKHRFTHTGESPYCCYICGKAFSSNDSLTKHMRTHTGDRPYCCSICGRTFSLKCNLTRHLLIHSD